MQGKLKKVVWIATLTVIAKGNLALAGGGGCGDFCDRHQKVMSCVATKFEVTSPNDLEDEWDKRNAESLARSIQSADSFKVAFYAISWSQRPFDPQVVQQAWASGLYDWIYSDRPKWPDYDRTKGYKIDPVSGAFRFSGIASPGWNKALASVFRESWESPAVFTLQSIETKKWLLKAELNCHSDEGASEK